MSYDNLNWFNPVETFFAGVQEESASKYPFTIQRLVPAAISPLVTVSDLAIGLSHFFQDAQFQQNACAACAAAGKLNQFAETLADLEKRIVELNGHVEAQIVAYQHQQELLVLRARAQAYEAHSATGIAARTRTRVRQTGANLNAGFTGDRFDQPSTETLVSENVMSSSLASNVSLAEAEELLRNQSDSAGQSATPTNNKKLRRKRKKPASSSLVKRPRTKSNAKADNNVDYECSICKKSFKTKARLDSHFLIHSGEKPFKCTECGKAFRHNPALFLHMKRHAGERKYKCSFCGHGFVTKWSLKEHERSHTQEKPHKCQHCDFTCSRANYLVQHNDRVHRDLEETPKVRLQCPSCPKDFKYAYDLRKHEINSHRADEKPILYCDQCGKKYSDPQAFKRHTREIHEGIKKAKAPLRHQCVVCGKLFRHSANLKEHSQIHLPEDERTWLRCTLCPKSFLSRKAFRAHQRRHEKGGAGTTVKPRKKRPSRKEINLIKECRSKETKILLRRVDGADGIEQRQQRLRRLKQRAQTYTEDEDEDFESGSEKGSESEWSGSGSDTNEESDLESPSPTGPKLELEVFEGFVPDVLYKTSEAVPQGLEAQIEDIGNQNVFLNSANDDF